MRENMPARKKFNKFKKELDKLVGKGDNKGKAKKGANLLHLRESLMTVDREAIPSREPKGRRLLRTLIQHLLVLLKLIRQGPLGPSTRFGAVGSRCLPRTTSKGLRQRAWE